MTGCDRRDSGVEWLSQGKFVFTYGSIGRCYGCGSESMLIVAERYRKLKCFNCGVGIGQDFLCWFCEYSISVKLLGNRLNVDCLLEKGTGDVFFCEDFKPGLAFGEDKETDVGERRRRAERVFSRFIFESCDDCKYFNEENVVRVQEVGGRSLVFCEPEAAFCEKRSRFHDWRTFCEDFELSCESGERVFCLEQKSKVRMYLRDLRLLEIRNSPVLKQLCSLVERVSHSRNRSQQKRASVEL